MLVEIAHPRQVRGEPRRRWFTDEDFDLIVWFDERAGGISGFQLCYDKRGHERALTWQQESGFAHERVDDGERPGQLKMTPILVPDGAFDRQVVAERFRAHAESIDPSIASLVHARLLAYPASP